MAHSADAAATFAAPRKLGTGTWKLEACPMDGGGLAFFGVTNEPETVWRREGTVFTSLMTSPEGPIATGTDCVIAADPNGVALAWHKSGTLFVQRPSEVAVGPGKLPVLTASGTNLLCVGEKDGAVLSRAFAR